MSAPTSYFHLSGGLLGAGSTIEPGNYGRVVMAAGNQHSDYYREMALEDARVHRFSDFPSRMSAAFGFAAVEEAREFRGRIPGFRNHVLYRVALVDPKVRSCLVESRLCGSQGTPDTIGLMPTGAMRVPSAQPNHGFQLSKAYRIGLPPPAPSPIRESC